MSRQYKTRSIRQLVTTAYTLEELRTLCYDEFRPVYEDYAEVRKSELVRHLIEHCERRGLFARLLRCVEEDAPEQYAAYANRLWEDGPPSETPPSLPAQALPSASPDRLTLTTPFVMEFVRVPAGPFLMGSDPLKDKAAQPDEQPQHTVDLPEFYIGKYPVTNAQFAAFLRAAGHKTSHWQAGSGSTSHPVTHLNWPDAVAFCHWFSRESGYLVRLPTEAEWEKAARGTDGRFYSWGNQPPTAELCYFGRYIDTTMPVGGYSPQSDSPYGAVDMAGNVWEWCSTIWTERAYPFLVQDEWREEYLKRGGVRVLRGGSWSFVTFKVRCAVRSRNGLDFRVDLRGFRVACHVTT